VFTGIYKRIFRSLKSEFKKIYRLNGLYLNQEEYFRVMDTQLAVFQKDYALDDLDIVPVADPTMASEAQRLARANALMQTIQVNPDPMGKIEILAQYYDAIGAKNLDKLLNVEEIKKQMDNPGPNPEMMGFQLETQKAQDAQQNKLHELEHAEMELIAKIELLQKQAGLVEAQTLKTIADAEAVEPGQQLAQYKAYADDMAKIRQHERELKKIGAESEESEKSEGATEATGGDTGQDTEGTPPAMAERPGNAQSAGIPTPSAPSAPGEPAGGENLESLLAGSNGDADYAAIGQNLRDELAAGNEPR